MRNKKTTLLKDGSSSLLNIALEKEGEKRKKKSYYNTRYSYLVTHPSTVSAEQDLTLLSWRNMLLSLRCIDSTVWVGTSGKWDFRHMFKVALNRMYRIVLNFAKSWIFPAYQNSIIRKNFTVPFLKYRLLKLKLCVFFAGHSVALVTYCVSKIIATCSPVIGQFFDTINVTSIADKWVAIMTQKNLSLGMCWKLFWDILSCLLC